MQNSSNPYYKLGGGWYFTDEKKVEHGPYPSSRLALLSCLKKSLEQSTATLEPGDPMGLTPEQKDLMRWLSREDYSQYGECHGKDLDRLVALGLAQVHEDNGWLGSFIAKGRGQMYCSVSLTEKGIAWVKENAT